MELRASDRVRWTRNEPASGLANGETATVDSIEKDGVRADAVIVWFTVA